MSKIMEAANKPAYTIIVVLAFACLATYSYGQRGYASKAEADAFYSKVLKGDVSISNDREYVGTGRAGRGTTDAASPAKPVVLYSEKSIGDARIFKALMEAENESK